MTSVHGEIADGLEAVAEAFVAAASSGFGAALHVRVDGRAVCDLWTAPWEGDTPSAVFSVSKGLIAILVAELVGDGKLDLDMPVATYWPHFSSSATVRQVMSHRAGLPFVREDLTRDDLVSWERMTDVLAAERPFFSPGSEYQYHALTGGWIVGEVIRRVSGLRVEELFRTRFTEGLGVCAWLGVPDDVVGSIAELAPDGGYPDTLPSVSTDHPELAALGGTGLTLGHALPDRLADPGVGFNDLVVQRAVIPAAGVIASARAVAKIYSSTVASEPGGRLLDGAVLDDMMRVQSSGPPALRVPDPWPAWGSGFMLDSDAVPMLSPSSYGHDGVGGQMGFADRERRVGFGFVSNGLRMTSEGSRTRGIVRALRGALA